MSAEGPIVAAGALALAGGFAREGGWPRRGTIGVVSTALLVIGAASVSRTKIAPIVSAFAWLWFAAVAIRTVPFLGTHNTKKK